MRHFLYEVSGPKELPLRSIALKDAVPGTVTFSKSERDGRLIYHWEARDVPRMYAEPSMPPVYTCVQRLLVSTIADWREISKLVLADSACRTCTPTDAMKATVADLTQGLTDRRKKIEALFKFVSQKVRYMGITLEKEAPGYEPHDVRITFDNKYGVCRDKAALLVEMLRLAEIEAFPVLIEVGPKKDADVPQPYFNHAIVAAREPDGSYLLMDPTDENTRELLPAYLSNDSYLVATPEGETLKTSPITPATENLMRIETTATLNAAGDLTAESVLHFDGINDSVYRDYFSRLQPEERRVFFEGLVRRAATGARLSGFELTPADLMDTSSPLTVKLRFEARGLPITNGETMLLPLPGIGARVGMVNFILGGTGLEKRKYPLMTEIACGLEETLTLKAEDIGKTLAPPAYEPVENDAVSFSESLARDGNTLTRKETFLLKVVEFTPAQYLTLKDALRTMERDERQKAVFAAAQPPADAEILSDRTEYELADAHSWTVTRTLRMKVLTYGGKKKNSEVKLGYNPAWEELTLESATVTAPDGSVKSAQKEEQNLMDAEWAGSAPRYPAAKTLVVSLPGVEVGSVIEYKVKRVCKDRPFFAARVAFRGVDPIQSRTLSVTVPADLPLAVQPHFADALHEQSETLENAVRREWSAADQRSVKPEILLPPSWAYLPTVCLSTGNWKTYGAQVEAKLKEAASGQKEAQRQAKALIQGAADDAARLTAIRNFVAKQIRYAGPGLDELPLSAVTPADRTLKESYGNSADRAVLAPRPAAGRRLPAGVRPRLRRAGRRQPGAAARRRAEPVGLRRRARARAARRQGGVPERHRRVRRARRHRARRLLRARHGRREALHHQGPAHDARPQRHGLRRDRAGQRRRRHPQADELLRLRLCRRAQAVRRDGPRGAPPVLHGSRRADFPGRDRRGRSGDVVRFVSRRRAIHRPRPGLRRPQRRLSFLHVARQPAGPFRLPVGDARQPDLLAGPAAGRHPHHAHAAAGIRHAGLAAGRNRVEGPGKRRSGPRPVVPEKRGRGGGRERRALRDRADHELIAGHDSGDGLRGPAPHPEPDEPPERAHGAGDGGRRGIDQPAGGFLCFVAEIGVLFPQGSMTAISRVVVPSYTFRWAVFSCVNWYANLRN